MLIVSFVALATLWPRPRLESVAWRPLPWGVGARLGGRAAQRLAGGLGVVLLVVVLVSALAGSSSSADNFAPTFVFIVFWVGLAFASALLGDVFGGLSPWRALGRTLEALVPSLGRRPYPEQLGRWPAALMLIGFAWIELISGWSEEPRALGTLILVYTAITLVAQAIYGTETWSRRGEGFAVYFGLLARISKIETRGGVVGLRPLLGGLPRLDRAPGTVAVVVVMIATTTFDGLRSGSLWREVGGELDAVTGSATVSDTLGIALCAAVLAGFYALGIGGARTVGGTLKADDLRARFVHTLVPIALVYVFAHYLTFLLFEGQAIFYLASDPLGRGWDLFGTAAGAIDFGLVTQNQTWYLQVAFVIAGHVAALALAHDRALATFGDARRAARSQYWMLGIMIGFTTLALWLLAQAGA